MEPEAKGKAPKGQGSRQLVTVKLPRLGIRKICSHYSKPAVQVQGGNRTTRPREEGGHQSRDLEFKIPSSPLPVFLFGCRPGNHWSVTWLGASGLSSPSFICPPHGDFSNLQFPILSCPCTSTVKKKIWVSLYGLQGYAYSHPASQCDPLQWLVSLAGAGPQHGPHHTCWHPSPALHISSPLCPGWVAHPWHLSDRCRLFL